MVPAAVLLARDPGHAVRQKELCTRERQARAKAVVLTGKKKWVEIVADLLPTSTQ
jgi:hypothetical protein